MGLLEHGGSIVRVTTMLKKFVIAVTLISVFVVQFNARNDAAALPPTGDWVVCVSMGWESDCGTYDLYGSGSEVVNRVIGGSDLADGFWDCAVLGANGCRAVKTGTVTPSYVTETSTSTSTTTVGDSSSSTSATTVAQPSALSHCPTAVCGYAVVDDQNYVYGVIVCSDACTGTRMTQSYMGCPAGCRLILQTQQTSDGNVAGWHGQDVKYDENSGSYTLPGGGTLKSGDKLEDAVFPKVVTVGDIILPDVVETIAAPSGKLYETTEEYANAETETVIASAIISIDLPTFHVGELTYQVSFDPTGNAPEFPLQSGEILNGIVSDVVIAQQVDSLASATSLVNASTKIVLRRTLLNGKNGNLKVTLRAANKEYVKVNIKVVQPKRYSSCKALVRDYPGGVVAGTKWSDKSTLKQKFDFVAKPTLNIRVFVLNQKFDFDRDKVVCEKNN